MQNMSNIQHSMSSSDEESSVVDNGPQLSCSTSARSSHSIHSTGSFRAFEHNNIIPTSVFLDDGVVITHHHEMNEEEVDTNKEDQSSTVTDIQNMDELMYYGQGVPDHEDGDVTVHSTESYCEANNQYSTNNCFHEMTPNEVASYKILSLLDTAGAPRICYDRLIALLKKLSKKGFDVRKAIKRETLMQRLAKYTARPRIEMCLIKKQEVFRFMFQDMLQDLLNSCSKHLHKISPTPLDDVYVLGTEHELWNTPWMANTFAMDQYCNFDSNRDIMLPIVLYMDKTGTDVNQRYSLKPVLFSLAALPREQRESRHSWRHIGFVPPKANDCEDESSTSLQFYHDCLSYLLDGLREAQKNPPTVAIKLLGGETVQRRAFLPLMVVMGDQLSQDTLCGRLKSNSGGAGRVHRSCMCSYLNVDDPYHQCKKVSLSTLNSLTSSASISDEDMDSKISSHASWSTKDRRTTKSFLLKQRTMFRGILRHPFTIHPIKNAFTGIDFGSWKAGIHDATLDDFMHSVEAGMVAYITETVYDGLTKKEKETVEQLTRPMLTGQRCSVISTFPRWRLQSGFTRQTLMTSGERVGSVLALSLSLHDPVIRETIQQGHHRQVQKYLDLSTEVVSKTEDKPPPPPPEFYLEQHMHVLDDLSIRHTLEHTTRHGFPLNVLEDLDPFQINQMIWQCQDTFKSTSYPESYPSEDIDGSYTDLGKVFSLPPPQISFSKVCNADTTNQAALKPSLS